MEESVRLTFRIKFIKLVVLLNIFIFSLAGAVLAFLIVPSEIPYKLPLVLILSIVTGVSGFISRREYLNTKKWLELHGTSK